MKTRLVDTSSKLNITNVTTVGGVGIGTVAMTLISTGVPNLQIAGAALLIVSMIVTSMTDSKGK